MAGDQWFWVWTASGTLFPSLADEPVQRSMCRDEMELHRDVRTAPDRTAAPTDIVEARALVTRLLRTIAPNVDVATIDRYESVHDIADLDSLDFVNLMSAAAAATGVLVPPRDYPLVVTVEGFAKYLLAHRAEAR